MAKKKIFLIAFAALASFSVLANNFSHTNAPTVVESVTAGEVHVVDSQSSAQTVSVAPMPVVNMATVDAAAAVPISQTVPAPASITVSEVAAANEIASAESTLDTIPVPVPEEVEHESSNDGIVAIGGETLLSVWVDVPKLVFRNVSLPGARPEQPLMVSETIELVPPVTDPNSDTERHTLKIELARPSTNFVYHDEKLGVVAISRSLLPSDSIASSHSASTLVAGSNVFDSERTLGTLPVNGDRSHFQTNDRNHIDEIIADTRETLNIGLLPSIMPSETALAVNEVAVLPLRADQAHFDSAGAAPIGLGYPVPAGERNEVAELMASLIRSSTISVQSVGGDRFHASTNFQERNAGLIPVAFANNESVLAIGSVDSIASNSGHSIFAANVDARVPTLSTFARDDSPSLLGSSIVFPEITKPVVNEFSIAANIGSHIAGSDRSPDTTVSFAGDEILTGLTISHVPNYVERNHEVPYFGGTSFTAVTIAERSASDLYFEPASSISNARHTSSSDSLAGVFVDRKTASLFAPETDRPFMAVDQTDLATTAKSFVKESKPASNVAPLLIDAKVAMSHSLIAPMTGPQSAVITDDVPAFTGTVKGGPSIDLLAPAKISTPGSASPAAAAAATSPVLIGGRPEFSSDLLKPMNTKYSAVSPPAVAPSSASTAATTAVVPQIAPGYCDAGFVGDPIRFSQTVELRLEDLLSQLHSRFGINFIMSPNVGKVPLNVKAGSIPWNVLLRSQLFVSGIRARCIDANTIELVENSKLPSLQDSAAVSTRFVKLKYLQRTSGGTVDSANRLQGSTQGGGGCGGSVAGGSSGSGGGSFGGGGGGQGGEQAGQQSSSRFDRLVEEIEKVLGLRSMRSESTGSSSGSETEEIRANRSVTQIPGRNILVITATEEEHQVVDQIIALADRPPFQVLVKGLIYGANQDRLLDLGTQTTITGGNAAGDITGGIFGHTLGTPGTLFDFSAVVGTFEFNTQFTALEQKGVLSVKSRPFTTVIDGLCTMLNVGKELPIVIESGEFGGGGDVVFVNAANNLAITPYVIDDDNGNPVAVTLELRLEANDVDSSITTRGVPAISKRSVQTQLLLGKDKTAILGGFTVDQDSKTVFKTPGLGDIPIIGELFKRRVRDTRISRLYFAITASVISYPDAINPVNVPGATTDIQNITPDMKKRADEAEKTPAKKSKDN